MALPQMARWWTNGGLICCLETTLVWIYVDDLLSHEELALWLLSDRNATRAVRSPDGDEWAEDLSSVDPNFGTSGPGLCHGSGCVQEEEEGSMHSEHVSWTSPCVMQSSAQESK